MANTHGIPSPKNTFTELDPVTLPIAGSAQVESLAAFMDARVSGSDVPIPTIVIAVTEDLSPMTHPNKFANSPTIAVMIPIKESATKKANHPPHFYFGGIKENKAFHTIVKKWIRASPPVTSSTSLSSVIDGPSEHASMN